jgi:hypothetical protein
MAPEASAVAYSAYPPSRTDCKNRDSHTCPDGESAHVIPYRLEFAGHLNTKNKGKLRSERLRSISVSKKLTPVARIRTSTSRGSCRSFGTADQIAGRRK